VSAVDVTPERVDGSAPDAVVIATIPRSCIDSTVCQTCSNSGQLAIAYYTGGRRDGQFYACSVTHAAAELGRRGRDLFPGVTQ
jgi:hypothetical protein